MSWDVWAKTGRFSGQYQRYEGEQIPVLTDIRRPSKTFVPVGMDGMMGGTNIGFFTSQILSTPIVPTQQTLSNSGDSSEAGRVYAFNFTQTDHGDPGLGILKYDGLNYWEQDGTRDPTPRNKYDVLAGFHEYCNLKVANPRLARQDCGHLGCTGVINLKWQ